MIFFILKTRELIATILCFLCIILSTICTTSAVSANRTGLYEVSAPVNRAVLVALSDNDDKALIELVKNGADLNKVTMGDGRPILPAMSEYDEMEDMFRLLITLGADIHVRDNQGRNLLMNLIRKERYQYAEILINEFEPDINTQSKNGKTAIALALDIFSPSDRVRGRTKLDAYLMRF